MMKPKRNCVYITNTFFLSALQKQACNASSAQVWNRSLDDAKLSFHF